MRVEEQVEWERPFPVRFLIVGEDEDGEPLLLGRCAAAEGLFVDPPPPPREVLVLRGCAPGAAAGWLGSAWITGRAADGGAYWWELADAEILAVVPHPGDPALVDVVVGTGVGRVEDFRFSPDSAVRFELTVHQGEPLAVADTVSGLLVARSGPERMPVRLIGCEPAELLRPLLDGGSGGWPTYTELLALDGTGRVMNRFSIGLAIDRSWPSVLGGGLVDVLLSVDAESLPGAAAREVWRRWLPGRPQEPGRWRGLSVRGKQAWQSLALFSRDTVAPDRSGGEYHLAGAGVEDVTGLHCALGEAVNGPGGYYGRERNGTRDCLGGGFGAVSPFTLVWHDFAAGERELAAEDDPATGLSYPEELARMLEACGVTVVRA